MTEVAVNFGPGSGLVGVLTEPTERSARDLAVVFLNSGILHRTGPNRVYVRLARRLAQAGHVSFRIDMAGIGDSGGMGTTQSVDEESLESVRASLDLLQARGIADRFIVLGLCSGAQYGFLYALRDPRVVGLVGIDPPIMFRTPRYYRVLASEAALRPAVWGRFLTGRYHLTRYVLGRLGSAPEPIEGTRLLPDEAKALVRRGLEALVERDVKVFLLVTGSRRDLYNYRSQLFDTFPGLGLEGTTHLALHPGADHTFTHEDDRALFVREVLDWVEASGLTEPA